MRRKKQILVVDDSRLNRKSFASILEHDYEVLEADNGKEALNILKENAETISLIILDLIMPVMDGFMFMEEFRKVEAYKDIPIIVATTSDDMENERRCLKMGVWDFVSKKFHPEIIRFRVLNAINKSKNDVLKYDFLTGIYNEQQFLMRTRELLDEVRDTRLAFIHFDIDRFKTINSFYGAKEGDKLICNLAHTIETVMDEYGKGTYGRISGDIFCMCLPYEKKEDILQLLKNITAEMRNYKTPYYLETSAGIYLIEDNDAEISVIFDKAAIAAQECKGRYMVNEAFYSEEMGERLLREQRIINEMDTALKEEQFVVYFQPKYELTQFRPYGAEALVRWKRPDGTMISPSEFIPIFEKNGFITKLDYYVWERVCRFIRKELDEGREPAPISVNVSRVNLYTPKFLEKVVNLVEKYKISPKYLNLELTESVFSESGERMREAVDYFHKAGFTIMMDDFGSGYSSLNVLKDVNLDVLKIDMKFLSKGESDIRGEKILEAVIRMAESLQMPVIAEGVEEKHQVDLLIRLGCNYIQGYYFAKPMPQAQYSRLIQENKE